MKKMTLKTTVMMLLLFFFAPLSEAATINVPGDWPTIQQAIGASANGDVVLVAAGTYVENIDFSGKAISVIGQKGPTVTIIDGNRTDSVVIFQSGEGANSILEGFCITNGQAAKGAGIYCRNNSSPTIRRNLVKGNSANWGAGIYCSASSPTIKDNFVQANQAISGGGIHCWADADAIIVNNVILHNEADHGAGIESELSTPVIVNNTVTENHANVTGGGIWFVGSDATVTNTIVWGNSADFEDPEIHLSMGSNPVITYSDVGGGWPGTGNIDADPQFAESAIGDYHLTYNSPCREKGYYNAPHLPEKDFEGDWRDPCGIPDVGADEFWSHLYCMGDIVPQNLCSVRITAVPGVKAWFVVGGGLLDPPFESQYGDLYLLPPYRLFYQGEVPSTGVLIKEIHVPAGWSPGESHHFQALLEWLPPLSYLYLSNLMTLTVE